MVKRGNISRSLAYAVIRKWGRITQQNVGLNWRSRARKEEISTHPDDSHRMPRRGLSGDTGIKGGNVSLAEGKCDADDEWRRAIGCRRWDIDNLKEMI